MDENKTSRPIDLFCYNIGSEISQAFNNQQSYTPSATVRCLRRDLAFLPAWITEYSDHSFVLCPEEAIPDKPPFLSYPLCNTISEEVLANKFNGNIVRLHLNGTEPGYTRSLIKKFPSIGFQETNANINVETLRSFYDRSLSVCYLSENCPCFTPSIIENSSDLSLFLSKSGKDNVIKQSYTSSGRGILRYNRDELIRNIKKGIIKYPFIIEPLYKKIADWATEFTIEGDKHPIVKYLGLSHFRCNQFKYSHNIIMNQTILHEQLIDRIGEDTFQKTINEQKLFLEKKVAKEYRGDVGIDMMIVSDDLNNLTLHPCVEINVRSTMGHYAIRLYERLCEDDKIYEFGIEYLDPRKKIITHNSQERTPPLFNHNGKLIDGCLFLTGVKEETLFIAYMKCRGTIDNINSIFCHKI